MEHNIISGRSLQNKRHDTYYILTGDVVFQVEDTLFRVHRYFFERESALFRDMLSLPAPAQQTTSGAQPQQTPIEGLSDEKPICLPQVSKEEFKHFLWVFYNPTYSEYNASAPEWTSILRLAHLWDFPMIRDLAFRQLDKELPVTRLALAHRYDAPSGFWARALTELVVREEPLSRAEGEEIGLEMVLKVVGMRERMQTRRLGSENRRTGRDWRRYSRSRSRSRSRSPVPIVVAPQMPQALYVAPVHPPTPPPAPIVIAPPIPDIQPWAWQHPPTVTPTVPSVGGSDSRMRRVFRIFRKTGRR